MIPFCLCGPDDVIVNGRWDLAKSCGPSSWSAWWLRMPWYHQPACWLPSTPHGSLEPQWHWLNTCVFQVVCPVCQRQVNRPDLRKHVREVHMQIKEHSCPVCQRQFKRRAHVTRHVANVHPQYGHTAEMAPLKLNYTVHELDEAPSDSKPHSCSYWCGDKWSGFMKKSDLESNIGMIRCCHL